MLQWSMAAAILCVSGAVGKAAPPISATAFSIDGKHVVLGSQAGLQVLSWPDLKPSKGPKTELSHVHDLSFSPDSKTLLVAGGAPAEEGAVEIYAWPDLIRIDRVKPHKDLIYRVAWSPDGQRWATASGDGTCRVYDAATRKIETTYEGHSRAVLAITFLPDSKSIVSAGVDQSLQVWDAATGKMMKTLDNHVAPVNDLAVRPNYKNDAGPMVVSVSDDRTVRLWQPTLGRLVRFARLKTPARAVAWSPDGARLLVGCNDGRLRVLDPDSLEVVSDKGNLEGRIHTLAIHPTEKNLLLGGAGYVKLAW